jgi:hypothetical protein
MRTFCFLLLVLPPGDRPGDPGPPSPRAEHAVRALPPPVGRGPLGDLRAEALCEESEEEESDHPDLAWDSPGGGIGIAPVSRIRGSARPPHLSSRPDRRRPPRSPPPAGPISPGPRPPARVA